MKKIAVFVSGGGSDMASIIDAIENGEINGKIELVVSNKKNIFALDRAKKANIDTQVFTKKDYGDIQTRDNAILKVLKDKEIDFIVLAGYLSIVSNNIVKAFENKIINIHPSLIPKYCGMGYYGLKVHEEVVKNKEKVSGCTVHFVDETADTGKIICQVEVPVLENDTAETLQARVLEQEHNILPKVVKYLCDDNLEGLYEKKSIN